MSRVALYLAVGTLAAAGQDLLSDKPDKWWRLGLLVVFALFVLTYTIARGQEDR